MGLLLWQQSLGCWKGHLHSVRFFNLMLQLQENVAVITPPWLSSQLCKFCIRTNHCGNLVKSWVFSLERLRICCILTHKKIWSHSFVNILRFESIQQYLVLCLQFDWNKSFPSLALPTSEEPHSFMNYVTCMNLHKNKIMAFFCLFLPFFFIDSWPKMKTSF